MRKSQEWSVGSVIVNVWCAGVALVCFLLASELSGAGYHAKAVGLGLFWSGDGFCW